MKVNPAALKEIRERSGYSKSELASRAGIALSYLSEMESGKKGGTPKAITKVADALKCPLAALIQHPDAA